ncbi:MAG: hypothetical protein JXQ90_01650 [Cyclobacteriaceae bacterium]
MMKSYHITLLLIVLILGCEETPVEPIQRIGQIELFDTDNSASAKDLTVLFEAWDLSGVDEFRVILIPSDHGEIQIEDALKLDELRYHVVEIKDSKHYAFDLPSMLDVRGEEIKEGKNYRVKILMVGANIGQLSLISSNGVTIENNGKFDGYYVGTIKHNINSRGDFSQSGQLTTSIVRCDLRKSDLDQRYLGTLEILTQNGSFFNPNTSEGGSLRFEIDDQGVITEIESGGAMAAINNVFQACDETNQGLLDGIVEDKLIIRIIGENCEKGVYELNIRRTAVAVSI